LGVAKDKSRTLAEYKASLVIENNGGYMSEKLVDCILSGTVPVYVGAPVEKYGIPRNLVIEARANYESISRAAEVALTWDSQDYIDRVKTWISQSGVREQWYVEAVNSRLLEFLCGKVAAHPPSF
jgi:hypothetical protein